MVPELRFLLLFRRPWDVVDSLFRRGDSTYTKNPNFAVHVLQNYNRAILDFHNSVAPWVPAACSLTSRSVRLPRMPRTM